MVARRVRAAARLAQAITLLVTAWISLAGCGSTPRPSAAPIASGSPAPAPPAASASPTGANAWTEPAAYNFTLGSSCGERALIGTFRVTVEDYRTIAFVGIDAAGKRYQGDPGSIPTIGAILQEASDAKARNASRVEVTRDPLDGHPLEVTIDRLANAIDDESCYRITDYVAAGG